MTQPDAVEDDFALEANFIEQAEYLEKARFLQLLTEHPDEETIIKKLTGGGAKLLIGPRGCGKSTLLLKAYYLIVAQKTINTLPIYVNFKLALKVEPLYHKGPNAAFWFRRWLFIKVLLSIHNTIADAVEMEVGNALPSKLVLERALSRVEAGRSTDEELDDYALDKVHGAIEEILSLNDMSRCVLLMDDAAHAFSEKQQEDFFDFFREIKSKRISPKAAVYPGVTSHSPSFHVGHDAERVDVWVRPYGSDYERYMIDMARRRFGDTPHDFFETSSEELSLLAYSAFGIPRAFLSMIRAIADSKNSYISSEQKLQRRKVLELSRQGRDMSHATFASLGSKLPAYKAFIESGSKIYQSILSTLKAYNTGKPLPQHGLQFGMKSPISPEIEKTLGFLQYSGLVMPAGDTMRGVKGTYELFDIHFGDLIAENTIVGRRTKSISSFLEVLRGVKHQAWPRINDASLINTAHLGDAPFALALPACQVCGTERPSESARFCSNCGAQLKSASTYESLVSQNISVLPISNRMKKRIKENSNIRTVRDILIDTSRDRLRGIKYIGEIRAAKIISAAEEHIS
ncbi:hypothetical protein LNKW23_32130 [Paralimibaculum aggregatum]|uniref:Zinc ribbon domain-containing protein n=1 Tax=Paralimibaculum aggregatum TaxID=3036245 RepID=A0ABQ6LRH6_9RHOB|nr:hypothetical protein [Limibaculum sp. NKW23]GMG83999.1 hypothetical protein LNKW23_32130 [Limibaculum sp. NKW23]